MKQAKKIITRMLINNWGGISHKMLEFHEYVNLFSGKSGSGKSTVMDAIQVGLGMGSIPGVEVLRHGLRRKHPDIRRQMLVERQRQLLGRDTGVGMEIQPEAQRVHPGIGAAAALDIGP